MNRLEQSSLYHDTSGLDQLRQAAQQDDKKALRDVANHFEGIFMRMMLKSMRQAEDVLADDNSPFNSQNVRFYRGMHDDQMANDLSASGALGLADLIVEQLDPTQHRSQRIQIQQNNLDRTSYSFSQAAQNASQSAATSASEQIKKSPEFTFTGKQDFVRQLLPVASEVTKNSPISAVAMVAQAALETGWGQKMIKTASGENALNFFGIKADGRWQGDKAVVGTLEYRNGIAKTEKAAFRAYQSPQESMQDYLAFIQNSPRYQNAVAQSGNETEYFKALQQAGYATDPEYANKIINILKDPVFEQAKNMLKF
ncbi:flagellar assembly peptidoglycan hydrolase FlgJ [Gayadomonas joobiniege]|uniref:flagellar assembly peptidoglycan hydrolase FlgJ n=1 Tax=Gayadomonas joobiniege TaxID=1234606 RepID=UPI00038080DD|nr:flagellar assembly peptidoglycan hydrolase FlgJ [Gayadomonas joobiniege]